MIELKEALIGRHNIDNTSAGERYVVLPFSGDGKFLLKNAYRKRIPRLSWDIFILTEQDFYQLYGKDPKTVMFKQYSERTVVWKTDNSEEIIRNDFKDMGRYSREGVILHFSGFPDYYQVK